MSFRIGLGQDSHVFSKNDPLVLGGVKISDDGGLEGNSDADVIIHSLCNALSSAIGGGSLGTWANAMFKSGIKDSSVYLKYILDKITEKKYQIGNISISVEAKKPYLNLNQINLIKNQIASLCNINIEQVGITFTSGEGLTAFGKGEGMQVLTAVLLLTELTHVIPSET